MRKQIMLRVMKIRAVYTTMCTVWSDGVYLSIITVLDPDGLNNE